jgi:hypothetical protein
MASKALLQAIAVTAELTGTQLSEAAARVLAADLSVYPEPQVMGALVRCRKELRGRMSIADVISRLDDGRPGPEEAWAMIPRDEATSVVWTDEMAQAWGIAQPLLESGDSVQARMAFTETYRAKVQTARDSGVPVKWTPSLGHDPMGREGVLIDAAEKGRLTAQHVAGLLPHREAPHPRIAALMKPAKQLVEQP